METKFTQFLRAGGNGEFLIRRRADAWVGVRTAFSIKSEFPNYAALRAGEDLEKKPTYGFNWDNVYKRYITQLIRKGYFHHHWKSKIVAVIPEQVYEYIKGRAGFMRSPDVKSPDVNIIFMTYCLEADPTRPGEYRPRLVTVEGTSHSNLQNAILYKDAPKKEAFTSQIKRSLVRAIDLAGLIATKGGTKTE